MKNCKQMSRELCLYFALMLALPVAATEVAKVPGDAARTAINPVPPSVAGKEAPLQEKVTHPQVKPRLTAPKQAAKSSSNKPLPDWLPASQSGLGCAEEKDK